MTRPAIGRVLAAIGIALILILPLPAAALADEWLHDGSVVIRASRFSNLKSYSSPIEITVAKNAQGKWLIVQELSESRP